VVLVMCDQMQYQRQGTVDPLAYTPNLDRLSKEGVFFSHFYASNGQCVPSRASIQTGLYPHEAEVMIIQGFHGHTARLTGEDRTMGHVFRDAGYTTAYFGKCHFRTPQEELGYDHGGVGDRAQHPLSEGDRRIADAALAYLDSYDPDRPLFLTASFHMPHPPFEAIEAFLPQYPKGDLTLPESFLKDDLTGKPQFLQDHIRDGQHGALDEADLKDELQRYYTMISEVDRLFGLLRGALEAKGMWEDSVVAFTTDHGDMMGAHRMRKKGTIPYDEIFHIPMIFRFPRLDPPRRVVDDLAVNVSLPGTLIEAAGLEVPAEFRGGSLMPAIGREAHPKDEMIFYEHYGAYWGIHPFRVVQTREWKYVKYYGPDDTEELYNLKTDPAEVENLAGDPAAEQTRSFLEEAVDRWWRETGGKPFEYYESDAFKSSGTA
jgi:arylsulfatase A-like enzyme